jgi:hypothetical protein
MTFSSRFIYFTCLYTSFLVQRDHTLWVWSFFYTTGYIFSLTISHIHLQFYVPQVYNLHLYFLGSHLYKYKWFFIFYPQVFQIQHFFTGTQCANNTRPSPYHISHYIFSSTI